MATTFKATVRERRKDGFYQVYIRVTHGRKVGYVRTDKIVTDAYIGRDGNINNAFVMEYCQRRILRFAERLNRVDASAWTVRQVIDYVTREDDDLCFSDYARRYVDGLVNAGQERSAKNYLLALRHMERYAGTTRVMFSQMTSAFLSSWIGSLGGTHRAKEMYPVCMRQVFRAAVREYNDEEAGIVRIKSNPWGKVVIPHADRTAQLAISPEECRLFFSAPLPASRIVDPTTELGRDVAKMILCLAGINTIDLYELRKGDYRNGCLCYKRAKTRRARTDEAYFEIRVEPAIRPLIEKYLADDADDRLLGFRRRFATSDSFNACVNTGIKRMCKSLGIPRERWYSAYTFRHTWGTVAQNDCGASIDEVAFAMNHAHGHRVTRGYIKLDFTPAWDLNARVIDFVMFSNAPSKQGAHSHGIEERREDTFRIAPKYMVYARAYFRGEVLAEASDIGFNNIDEIITRLAAVLPDTIPQGCAVQFRICNVDTGCEAVYERTKGRGF